VLDCRVTSEEEKMRLTQTQRLLATAVVLLAGTAVLWWLVGYPIGKGIIDSPAGLSAFRRGYGFQEAALVWLFALALVVPATLAVLTSYTAQLRWPALAAIAIVAVLFLEDKVTTIGSLGVALFVLGVAAVSESEGRLLPVVALVAGFLVAFVYVVDSNYSTGEKLAVMALRAVFYFGPLLAGPHYIETYVLKAAKGR
jgi:hypothetical protein